MNEILRSAPLADLLPRGLSAGLAGDEHPWPVDPQRLAALYAAEPTHARACHVKAEGIAGRGWLEPPAGLAAVAPVSLLVRLALDVQVYGNAFAEIVPRRGGGIAALRPLPAPTCTLTRAEGLRQRVWDGMQERVVTLPAGRFLHLLAPCPLGYRYALPAWLGVAGMLDLLHAVTRYNARFFEAGAVPEYALIHTGQSLSAAQQDVIRDFFRGEFQGVEHSRRTLVLSLAEGQKVELTPVSRPQDGDFLKLVETARNQIPSAHGVPPRLLGVMAAGQLGGGGEVQQQMHLFETFVLAPARRILTDGLAPLAAALGDDPATLRLRPIDLTPAGEDAKDIPALVAAGVLDLAEARAMLGREAAPAAPAGPVARSQAPGDTDLATLLAALLERL